MDYIVRKNAHFFIYLCLGILTITALKRNGVRGLKCIVFGVLLCILYAGSDEIHQSFVSGRSTQFIDVIIDSTGAIIWILIKAKSKKLHPRGKVRFLNPGMQFFPKHILKIF